MDSIEYLNPTPLFIGIGFLGVYISILCCLFNERKIKKVKSPIQLNKSLNECLINKNPLIIIPTTENNECCICLQNYLNNEDIVRLPCKHIFHKRCIFIWFLNKQYCPLCKRKF